jgi:hypothetical protein
MANEAFGWTDLIMGLALVLTLWLVTGMLSRKRK